MTLDEFLGKFAATLPHGSMWALAITVLAGIVASAVCPCTIPVGLGVAGIAGSTTTENRRNGFLIAIAFFLGIVVNLAILGTIAGRMGSILTESFGRYWALGMALVSFLAALVAFRGPRVRVKRLASLRRPGLMGTFLYGFIFSLGTSAAPLLLLLTVAAAQARPEYGFMLALAFGIGRGLPFLLVGVFAGTLMRFARLTTWTPAVRVVSGCALLFVTFYYVRAFTALL